MQISIISIIYFALMLNYAKWSNTHAPPFLSVIFFSLKFSTATLDDEVYLCDTCRVNLSSSMKKRDIKRSFTSR